MLKRAGLQDICQGRLQALRGASPRGNLSVRRKSCRGCPSHALRTLADMELQNLMFVSLDFGFALI